jgi:putative peptidoglycan binding protein
MASWRTVGYAALGALVVTGTGWLVLHRPVPATPAPGTPALGSATVVRTNVTARDIVTGSLGYLDPVTVVAGTNGGVLTWLPDPGTTVGQDQRLYEVDGRPVVLWTGARPAWRDLVPGMPAGPDVTQAEQNLAAHGYGGHLTGAAIRHWQAAHGLPRTGVIGLGQVVFLPGAVRVGAVPAALGTPLHPGLTVLTATATGKAVSVRLDPNRQGVVHSGDRVTVTLPDTRTTPGTVSAVGPPGLAEGAQTVTIPVTVRLTDPAAVTGLDAGTVQVSIVTAQHDNVLAVPIEALLAAPGGGYQVAVTNDGSRRAVTVHCGLFDETGGLVEVTGDLRPGLAVEVPAEGGGA